MKQLKLYQISLTMLIAVGTMVAEDDSRRYEKEIEILRWSSHALQTYDLLSTELALRDGGREVNPLMQNRGVRYAWKAGSIAMTEWMIRKNPNRKLVRNLLRMNVIVTGGVFAWNMTVLF